MTAPRKRNEIGRKAHAGDSCEYVERSLMRAYDQLDQRAAAIAAVLAYLDECDNGMGSVQASEVRALLGAATTPTRVEPAEVCSKCGTALALHLPRWLGIAPVEPDYETPCTCGRALPCRHCPEETT